MKKTTFQYMALSAMFIGTFGLASCDKNDEPTPSPVETKQHFVCFNTVDQKIDYLGTFADLSQKTVDNKKAFEFAFGAYPFAQGNTVLVADGNGGDKVHKFTRDANGYLVRGESVTFGQGSAPGEITFSNDGKAYVVLSQRGKISILDVQTMKQTAEIDLSQYAYKDNNPDPGCAVLSKSKDKLYVALQQKQTRYTAYPGIGAEVAIINLKTHQVEKVIKDDRVGFVGLFRHTIAFTDELGDMYFYSLGMEGNNPLKDGFVRIKNGTDEWDKDYHFQLSKTPATGIDKPHGWILYYYYAGNGIVYACVNIPSLTMHNDPAQSSILDFNYQPVRIDVRNKTIVKINLPLTTSMGCFTYGKWKDEIVFGMTCKEGTGYYTYNPATGACSPKPVVTTVGVPSSLLVFE